MEKGILAGISDSSITVYKSKRKLVVPITGIGLVKTKRATGNSILVCGITGGTFGGVIGTMSDSGNGEGFDIYTTEDSFLIGGVLGTFVGTPTGAAIVALQKREVLKIDGSYERWQQQMEILRMAVLRKPSH